MPPHDPVFPGESAPARSARMLRVDHAGEVAAKRIYEGQLAVLKPQPKSQSATELIEEMADREDAHLAAFERMVTARQVRPTLLSPLWDMAAFGLGAASALLGPRAAMACTAAVEEAICEHYQQQLDELGTDDPELSAVIAEFRADEMAHRQTALANGAEEVPAYRPFSEIIKAGCRLAIRLSERI
jgi:3-demethoxyubiquinol 3-hydroxylase